MADLVGHHARQAGQALVALTAVAHIAACHRDRALPAVLAVTLQQQHLLQHNSAYSIRTEQAGMAETFLAHLAAIV